MGVLEGGWHSHVGSTVSTVELKLHSDRSAAAEVTQRDALIAAEGEEDRVRKLLHAAQGAEADGKCTNDMLSNLKQQGIDLSVAIQRVQQAIGAKKALVSQLREQRTVLESMMQSRTAGVGRAGESGSLHAAIQIHSQAVQTMQSDVHRTRLELAVRLPSRIK